MTSTCTDMNCVLAVEARGEVLLYPLQCRAYTFQGEKISRDRSFLLLLPFVKLLRFPPLRQLSSDAKEAKEQRVGLDNITRKGGLEYGGLRG